MADLDRRRFDGAGEQVVGQGAGKRLTRIIIGYLFVKGSADALHHAAPDLALDEHRIDHCAAILGDRKVEKLDKASLRVNRYNGTVCGVRIDTGANRRLVGCGHVEQRVDTRREPIHPQMRNLGYLGNRNRGLRPPTPRHRHSGHRPGWIAADARR